MNFIFIMTAIVVVKAVHLSLKTIPNSEFAVNVL